MIYFVHNNAYIAVYKWSTDFAYPSTYDLHNNAYISGYRWSTKLCISGYKWSTQYCIHIQLQYYAYSATNDLQNYAYPASDVHILRTYLLGDLCTTRPSYNELPQVAAILKRVPLDDIPSMVEGFRFTAADDRVRVGREIRNQVWMLAQKLLRSMDRIEASSQPCIAQQLFFPHVEAFSSAPLLWILKSSRSLPSSSSSSSCCPAAQSWCCVSAPSWL